MKIVIFLIVFMGMLSLFYISGEVFSFFNRKQKKKQLERTFGPFGEKNAGKPGVEKIFTKKGEVENPVTRLQHLLITADIHLSPSRFLLFTFSASGVLFIVATLILQAAWAGLLAFILGSSAPFLFLIMKKRKVQQEVIRQMPDALGMIVRSIRIGQSVDGALRETALSMSPPFSTEIGIVYEEIRMGIPFDQALFHFERRYPKLSDVKIFTTAFIIQRETGGSLVPILSGLQDTIKKRFHFKRQIKTLSAEARVSAMVIGLLPLLFMLITYLFNPAYVARLTDNPLGRIILFAAFLLEITGFIIMHRMTRIKL